MATESYESLEHILCRVDLDTLLREDRENCRKQDDYNMWYHGKMSRQSAEKILHEAQESAPTINADGMFLVRDNTAAEHDFSLSVVFQSRCYHYYIFRPFEGYYCIEGGPTVHGLEHLIEHYLESRGRLVTRLTKLCQGHEPPPRCRKDGPTNILHRAVKEGEEKILVKMLAHSLCPDVNAKNEEGSTALHDAAASGFSKAVTLLLQHGADTKLKDAEGYTPLHRACEANQTTTTVILVRHANSAIQEGSTKSLWVPLHVAAMNGSIDCVKILLNSRAAVFPRDKDNQTPIDLAEKYHRTECIEMLESFKPPAPSTEKHHWFHPQVDRQGAEHLFSVFDAIDGLFLVRLNKSKEGEHVLSYCCKKVVSHYEIHSKEYRGHIVHYIDDSPYHLSLESLIEYYHCHDEGLPTHLLASVSPVGKVVEMKVPETYSNIMPPKPAKGQKLLQVKGAKKPDLPPRHPESPHSASPPSTPETEPEPLREIQKKHLKTGALLGEGEYGSVLKGILTLSDRRRKLLRREKVEVAVKMFNSVGNVEDFKQEAYVMQGLQNKYIVELLGVCYTPNLMLVEEFLPMGSMLNVLEKQPQKVRVRQELYLWASQIAKGMEYLETKRLVHRDLAARNILLHSLQHVKISDFGLSRAMGVDKEYYKASKGGRWPIKWYAPESVNFGHFSHASDVWSYGVTLWEMFSYGYPPFEGKTGVEVIKFIEDGCRLEKPEKCSDVVYEVMEKCWSYEPKDRPTFQQLSQHFEEDSEYISAREMAKALLH